MREYHALLRDLLRAEVRFVLIGVGGANYYARVVGELFATQDGLTESKTELRSGEDAEPVLRPQRGTEEGSAKE